jgi:Na+-driven multidrug efflux pump
VGAALMLVFQRSPQHPLAIDHYLSIRPDWKMIALVLSIGIPTGLENTMFQLGKLMIQSTVSTLGTVAIAAHSIISMLESFSSMPGMAVGLGLVTVAGQCMGAGRPDEARRYTLQFTGISAVTTLIAVLLTYLFMEPAIQLSHIGAESAVLIRSIMRIITICKPIFWAASFTPVNCMRAAGDVKYPLFLSAFSMWIFRVLLSYYLCRFTTVGLMGAWIGMATDWCFRAICFTWRFFRGRWMEKTVLKEGT